MRIARTSALLLLIGLSGCFSTGQPAGCSDPWQVSRCRCMGNTDQLGELAQAPTERTFHRGQITIRVDHEPGSLLSMLDGDPLVSQIADHCIYESLVRVRPDGRTVEPELALFWEEDPALSQLTFHLDPNARWHDDEPVTAVDVAFTFERLLDPGGEAVLRNQFFDIAGVDVVNDYTVTIRLDQYRPEFLLALSALSILPSHVFGRMPLVDHIAARTPVGSGPFVFSKWLTGQQIELTRNIAWRNNPPYIDRLIFRIVPDVRIAFDLFNRGDLDILPGPPAGNIDTDPRWRYITYPMPQIEAWVYNTRHPIFQHASARKAVGALVDMEAIRCSILGCRAALLNGNLPFTEWVESSPGTWGYNPDAAIELLEQDNWRDTDGDGIRERNGVEFTFDLLLPDVSPDLKRTAVVVQNDLTRAGIRMRLALVSWGVYLGQLKTGRFDASVIAVSTAPPFSTTALFHSRAAQNGHNFGRFEDTEVDRLLRQIQLTADPALRQPAQQTLSRRIYQLHPFTFTQQPVGAALVRTYVRGVQLRNGWFEVRSLWRTADPSGGQS